MQRKRARVRALACAPAAVEVPSPELAPGCAAPKLAAAAYPAGSAQPSDSVRHAPPEGYPSRAPARRRVRHGGCCARPRKQDRTRTLAGRCARAPAAIACARQQPRAPPALRCRSTAAERLRSCAACVQQDIQGSPSPAGPTTVYCHPRRLSCTPPHAGRHKRPAQAHRRSPRHQILPSCEPAAQPTPRSAAAAADAAVQAAS